MAKKQKERGIIDVLLDFLKKKKLKGKRTKLSSDGWFSAVLIATAVFFGWLVFSLFNDFLANSKTNETLTGASTNLTNVFIEHLDILVLLGILGLIISVFMRVWKMFK